ncbi:hypothetical protein ACHAPJ_000411 [Fusarium lateritium]
MFSGADEEEEDDDDAKAACPGPFNWDEDDDAPIFIDGEDPDHSEEGDTPVPLSGNETVEEFFENLDESFPVPDDDHDLILYQTRIRSMVNTLCQWARSGPPEPSALKRSWIEVTER